VHPPRALQSPRPAHSVETCLDRNAASASHRIDLAPDLAQRQRGEAFPNHRHAPRPTSLRRVRQPPRQHFTEACEWRRDSHLQILVGAPASGCPPPCHAQHPHTARPRGTRRLRQQIKYQSHRAHSCPREPMCLRDAGSSPNLRSGDGSSCLTEVSCGLRESPPQLVS